MAKSKVVKKKLEESEIINEVEKTVKKKEVKKGAYLVYIKVNDVVTIVDTDDIAGVILASKPEFIKTPLTVKVTKGDKTLDRFILLNQAKRLFDNQVTMEIFIKNLIF